MQKMISKKKALDCLKSQRPEAAKCTWAVT